ncbi:MAG: DUF2069 domain-containing protein [Burkholderiaceae bacterium]
MTVQLTALEAKAWRFALASWAALFIWCLLCELVLAPIRPGGSWLAIKALPLLIPLRGMIKRNPDSMQWALLIVLAYLAEGLVRVFEPAPYREAAAGEIAFATLFFVAAVMYLRPYKRAAKARRALEP